MKFIASLKYLLIIIFLSISVNIYGIEKSETYDYSLETVYSTMVRYIVIHENAKILDTSPMPMQKVN